MSFNGLSTAGSSLTNIQVAIDSTSHNIANLNSTGYKQKTANFEDVVGSGAVINSLDTDFSQGSIRFTGIATDLALNGDGFFMLQSSQGEVNYSRAGKFNLDANRDIVDPHGAFLLSTSGTKITVPSDAAEIAVDQVGNVVIRRAGNDSFENIAQLQLASFSNPQGLSTLGQGLFGETDASGIPTFGTALGANTNTAETVVTSGALEFSNVNLGESLVHLTSLQRSYQAVARTASTADELLQLTLGLSA